MVEGEALLRIGLNVSCPLVLASCGEAVGEHSTPPTVGNAELPPSAEGSEPLKNAAVV